MLAFNTETVPRIKLLGFVSYSQPWIHFKRNINEYVLYFIKSGELHIREDGVPHVLKRGDLFVLEPNLDVVGTERHTCDYYYIHFQHPDIRPSHPSDLTTLARTFLLEEQAHPDAPGANLCHFPKAHSFSEKKSLLPLLHSCQELVQLYRRRPYNRSMAALKFAELLMGMSREFLLDQLRQQAGSNTKAFVKVHALLDYIHQNYARKITSADIERELEGNYDYINRVFAKVTGYPIMRYVNLVRISHARELIEATNLSVGEIGYLTGLDDPYHFSKVFKKYAGLSPAQYFKQIRRSD